MSRHLLIIVFLACLLSLSSTADNAPVIRAGINLDAPLSPDNTSIPVSVSGFIDIGSFTLTLDYYSSVLTYAGFIPNAAFSGMAVTVSTPGRLIISWPQSGTGITMPDGAVLITLSFNYIWSGVYTTLDWYDNGSSCQFSKYNAGLYTNLNDAPYASYYQSGAVANLQAPVTIAPVITNASAGTITVPVKVAGFSNINSIDLTLYYASNVLTYNSFTPNPLVPVPIYVNSQPVSTDVRKIVVTGFGTPFSLPDTSIFLTLSFTYSNTAGNANYSELTWYDNGPSCAYSNGQFSVLYDEQTSLFYHNGLVASQKAPMCWLPYMSNAGPGDPVSLPVTVSNFNSINSFNLTFEYSPAAMTYNTFTADDALEAGLEITDTPSGSNRRIVITWMGEEALSFLDATPVVTLSFGYLSGPSALTWITDDGTSCRFNDDVGNAFYDFPKTSYYHHGLVTSQEAPLTAAWYASPSQGQQVVIPVVVYRFAGIGYWYLTLDYDPGVLSFQDAALVPSTGGMFNTTTAGPGRIQMEWSGSPVSLADSSVLVNLTFNYNGGESALAWHDNGISCKYSSGLADPALYDGPANVYYINGYAGPDPLVADFMADNLFPEINTTVTLDQNAIGSPEKWFWSISPAGCNFINGTDATSKNPLVQFAHNGAYTIVMRVYRGSAAGVKVRNEYIHAGTEGLWTGITSPDWMTGSNWHNYIVPSASTNVVIPSSAPFWPHKAGILTIGDHCQSITLENGAQLVIEAP